MDVTIDLSKVEDISKVSMSFLESHGSWIFLPTHVILSFSHDGISYGEQAEIQIKYEGYIKKEIVNAEKLYRLDYIKVPEDFA